MDLIPFDYFISHSYDYDLLYYGCYVDTCDHLCWKRSISELLFAVRSFTALCDVGISVGELLIVSAENRPLIAVATGSLTTFTDTTVTMVVDR